MIKAIFFDMDGVLCQGNFTQAITHYEEEFGIPQGEFYKIIHDFSGWKDFTLGKIFEEDYLKMCAGRCQDYQFDGEKFVQLIQDVVSVDKKFIDCIRIELASLYTLGIISNNPKEWYDRCMKKIGLQDVLDYVILSSIEHVRKPSKEIFQIALDATQIPANEIIYVDDRPERTGGARELGMHVIQFDGDISKFKELLILSCFNNS